MPTSRSWVRAVAVVSVAGIALGTTAPAQAAGDANRGRQIAYTCLGCHGIDNYKNVYPTYDVPKLAGQHPEYLVKQLNDFKAQPGAKAPARNNAVMVGFASALTEQDMRNVAAYYASQAPQLGAAHNAATEPIGQKIYRGGIGEKGVPACASCHGPTGQGIPAQYPRLSGQWTDYTVAQLNAFQQGAGARNNNEAMRQIASRLTDGEIKAVADYIAGLR